MISRRLTWKLRTRSARLASTRPENRRSIRHVFPANVPESCFSQEASIHSINGGCVNEQTATIGSGSGNTIIQIVGSGNTIVPGHGWLQLTRHARRAPLRAATSELQQLVPYNRCTTLIGRTLEMEDLRRFAKSPEPISIRVLTGSGGTGKTRLALDFCDELAAHGWDSGFVGGGDAGGQAGELQRFAQSQNLSAWGWRKPTFVVVDYAAGHVSALAT